jgi:hypothetical protein
MMVGSASGARIVLKIGFRVVVTTGAAMVAGGTLLLTRLGVDSSQTELSLYLVVLGFGMGLVFMSTALAAQNSVQMRQMGVATGLINFTRQLGGAIGVAIAASVMLSSLTSRLSEAFGGANIDADTVLAPTNNARPLPPGAREIVRDAFADSLNNTFWVAVVVAVIGLTMTLLMPRGSATAIRDRARRDELPPDAQSPEGETFAIVDDGAEQDPETASIR